MKARYKINLLLIVLLLALAAMSFTAFGIPSYTKNLANKSCTNCHVTAKASDIPKDSRNKAVSYAIAKGVFPVVNKKFGANKYITGDELKAAIQRAKGSVSYSGSTATLTKTQLAQVIFNEVGIDYNSTSYDSEVNGVKSKIANYNENEDRALALAVARGIIPVVAKTKTGLYAVKGYATRADAAYAITMAGLIRVAKNDKIFTPQSDVAHSDVTSDFVTWLTDPSVTDHRIANFCMKSGCHDSNRDSNSDGINDYDSILRIVYSTHYLMRTVTDLNTVSSYAYDNHTVEPGMFNRV